MGTLAASAARTTTGTGTTEGREGTAALATVTVTAATGTNPTLVVTIEGRDRAGNWVPLAVTPSLTAAGVTRMAMPLAGDGVRARWTIGGTTPSFTFSVATEGYS